MLNTDEYSISKGDSDLFLQIVRQILLNSRDEQCKIVDIYSRIERRNNTENEILRNKITELHEIVERQNLKIKELCETFGVDKTGFSSDIPSILQTDIYSDFDQSIPLNKLSIPLTLKDARRITRSFVTGLVIPQVHRHIVDGYAYVLPSEVLPIAMASGIKFECFKSGRNCSNVFEERSIFHTRYIKRIVDEFSNEDINSSNDNEDDEPILCVPLGLWSDGCDAGSASKANRNLVKLTTLHFVNPQIDEEHVFPVGLGDQNGNHEYICKKIMDDLEALCNSFQMYYAPSFNKLMKIKFFIAYIIQDCVEYGEFTGFSGHKGLCSTVPSLSCPIKMNNDENTSESTVTLLKQIQSCHSCFERRFLYYSQGYYNLAVCSNKNCSNCYDWDLRSVQYIPHTDYPMEMNQSNNNILRAKDISFDSMRKACIVMFEKLYLHEWSQKTTLRYGQVECVKTSTIMDIYKYAKRIRPRTKRFAQCPIPPFPFSIVPSGMNQKSFALEQCMVGIMHTLILNLGRHLLLTAVASLSESNEWTKFYSSTNSTLKQINKLSLSWCKCFYYGSTKKPGSMWVSENYLGFSFVCKSIFSFLNSIESDHQLILDIFWCYNSIICHVMQRTFPTNEVANRVGAMAKLFLSFFYLLDNSIEKRVASKIESTACVISILSLEKDMMEKGMQRNYWEGGWFGEGFFRSVKPLIQRGTHQMGVFVSTMQKIYQVRGISEMIDNDDLMNDEGLQIGIEVEDNDILDVSRYRRFHAYSKLDQVIVAVENKEPLASFYHIPSNTFYVCYSRKKKC